MAGLTKTNATTTPPRWLLAELTYACPLQCPYCANPIDYAQHQAELDTGEWKRVLTQARKMGAVQLGFSGGEPLTRKRRIRLPRRADRLRQIHVAKCRRRFARAGIGQCRHL